LFSSAISSGVLLPGVFSSFSGSFFHFSASPFEYLHASKVLPLKVTFPDELTSLSLQSLLKAAPALFPIGILSAHLSISSCDSCAAFPSSPSKPSR